MKKEDFLKYENPLFMLYNIENKCLKICMGICNSVYLQYKIKQQFKTKDYGNLQSIQGI